MVSATSAAQALRRPGAVPPFGSLWNLRTFVDQSLIEQGAGINFNAGLKTHSVSMATADFIDIEKPTVSSFSARVVEQRGSLRRVSVVASVEFAPEAQSVEATAA